MDHSETHTMPTNAAAAAHHHTMTDDEMQECITGCLACHATCLQTVAHCLDVGGAHVTQQHVRLLLDCAELCLSSAHLMITRSPYAGRSCALCAEACRACEAACLEMKDAADLRCAAACRRCAEMLPHAA